MTVELEAMESRSRQLLSTAGTVLPGACLGQNSLPPELSFVVDHGEGARLVDLRGRAYLDYVLGSGPFVDRGAALTSDRALRAADGRKATRFALECVRRGIFTLPGTKLYLSLAHTDADVDWTLDAMEESLRSLA
jgi:glutamate-1-semialdehyde aminotransferase